MPADTSEPRPNEVALTRRPLPREIGCLTCGQWWAEGEPNACTCAPSPDAAIAARLAAAEELLGRVLDVSQPGGGFAAADDIRSFLAAGEEVSDG